MSAREPALPRGVAWAAPFHSHPISNLRDGARVQRHSLSEVSSRSYGFVGFLPSKRNLDKRAGCSSSVGPFLCSVRARSAPAGTRVRCERPSGFVCRVFSWTVHTALPMLPFFALRVCGVVGSVVLSRRGVYPLRGVMDNFSTNSRCILTHREFAFT